MEAQWTVEKAREELPDVKVKWNGKVYTASTGGKLNRFCSVSPFDKAEWMGVSFEFTWETVVRSLNTGSVLIA